MANSEQLLEEVAQATTVQSTDKLLGVQGTAGKLFSIKQIKEAITINSVTAGDMNAVTSNAVNSALTNYSKKGFSYTSIFGGEGTNYYDCDLSFLATMYGQNVVADSKTNYQIIFYNGDGGANEIIPIGYYINSSLGNNTVRVKFNGNVSGVYRLNCTIIPLF